MAAADALEEVPCINAAKSNGIMHQHPRSADKEVMIGGYGERVDVCRTHVVAQARDHEAGRCCFLAYYAVPRPCRAAGWSSPATGSARP